MLSAKVSARSSAKFDAERRLVRRREKEHEHQTKWTDQANYYKSWEKTNNKFNEWTSPRYYESNNRMLDELKSNRERKDKLEKRREKLRRLFDEEKRTYDIELMVKNRHNYPTKMKTTPTELLKDVHLGIKLAEEDRKRHEAELALYNHWRNNNPVIRDYERACSSKDLKLSWLDQQVEKRLEKERTEKECKKMLEERDRRLKEDRDKEEEFKREMSEKNRKLQADLEAQIEQLQLKQKQSEHLQKEEEQETKRLADLDRITESHQEENKRKIQRELALENLKLHKLKLKQKVLDITKNLEYERDLMKKLLDSEVTEQMADERKRTELKKAMTEFVQLAKDQQNLEKQRQRHFDFVFDSEAKLVYERQEQIWREEEAARDALMKEVMETLRQQVDEKMRRNRDKQREVLEERQNALRLVEERDKDIRTNREEEKRKRDEWKQQIEEQIKEKRALEAAQKLKDEKKLDLELEAVRREEERLRREIAELQRKQGPIRHARSRILP